MGMNKGWIIYWSHPFIINSLHIHPWKNNRQNASLLDLLCTKARRLPSKIVPFSLFPFMVKEMGFQKDELGMNKGWIISLSYLFILYSSPSIRLRMNGWKLIPIHPHSPFICYTLSFRLLNDPGMRIGKEPQTLQILKRLPLWEGCTEWW